VSRDFEFQTFPILITDRLILRQAQLSDAEEVLVFRSDPVVQRYNGPVFKSVEEAEALIEELQTEFEKGEGVSWGVTLKEQDRVIGLFGLHYWSKYHRRAEAGYDMARAFWGQGIGSEALRAILRFGFNDLDLNRIYAGTIADNQESVRMLERLGFTREGTRRKHSWEDDGTFHDSAMYGLLRDEFRGQ
jgi:ribosomal-protein-alanine N-acetyltransferase